MNWIKKHRMVVGVIFFVLLGTSGYFIFISQEKNSSDAKVKTETVQRGDVEILVTGSGQVKAESRVDLKPVVAGDAIEVMAVYVKNGQEVKKDQIIALLDSKDAQKSIRDAEIALRLAQIQLKQTEKANDTKTQEDKWERQLKEILVQQKSNSLSDAKDDLEDYYIKAPFDGVVTDLAVEAGDTISQTDVLTSVITKNLIANVILNEVDAAKVQIGNEVSLTFDALSDEKVSGKVSKVDTIGEVESGVVSYGVEIIFESPSVYLKPGMSVNAEIKIQKSENALVVSSAAVKTDKNGGSFVLVVSDELEPSSLVDQDVLGKTKKVKVKVGISDDVRIEILEGLSEGDVVLIGSLNFSQDSSATNSKKSSSSSLLNMGGKMGGRPMK